MSYQRLGLNSVPFVSAMSSVGEAFSEPVAYLTGLNAETFLNGKGNASFYHYRYYCIARHRLCNNDRRTRINSRLNNHRLKAGGFV
jgi:hypothetical protein